MQETLVTVIVGWEITQPVRLEISARTVRTLGKYVVTIFGPIAVTVQDSQGQPDDGSLLLQDPQTEPTGRNSSMTSATTAVKVHPGSSSSRENKNLQEIRAIKGNRKADGQEWLQCHVMKNLKEEKKNSQWKIPSSPEKLSNVNKNFWIVHGIKDHLAAWRVIIRKHQPLLEKIHPENDESCTDKLPHHFYLCCSAESLKVDHRDRGSGGARVPAWLRCNK